MVSLTMTQFAFVAESLLLGVKTVFPCSVYKHSSALSLFLFAALSMLRSSEDKAPTPQNKFMGDIEELAASYERKLIEVSAVTLSLIV